MAPVLHCSAKLYATGRTTLAGLQIFLTTQSELPKPVTQKSKSPAKE